jgi:hypothetical protein
MDSIPTSPAGHGRRASCVATIPHILYCLINSRHEGCACLMLYTKKKIVSHASATVSLAKASFSSAVKSLFALSILTKPTNITNAAAPHASSNQNTFL